MMDLDLVAKRGLDRETLRRLSQRSNARGALQLSIHLSLLCATGLLVWATRDRLSMVPAVVLQGIVLNFLFCPLHETTHWTAFASRRLNAAVGWICGFLLLLPAQYFRQFHFAHHRFTQDPAHDPELAQPAMETLGSYLGRATGLPNWRKRVAITLRHALTGRVTEPFVPARLHFGIVREARIVWSGYLVVLGVSLILRRADALVYWVFPVLVGQPFLRLFLMAEHTGCALSDNMLDNTRTTYTNGAIRLLTWQMPYHVEHHCFPSVPFHSLARVNARIRDRIEVAAPGYWAVHRSFIRRFQHSRASRS
jgi:fatty acid desaturase